MARTVVPDRTSNKNRSQSPTRTHSTFESRSEVCSIRRPLVSSRRANVCLHVVISSRHESTSPLIDAQRGYRCRSYSPKGGAFSFNFDLVFFFWRSRWCEFLSRPIRATTIRRPHAILSGGRIDRTCADKTMNEALRGASVGDARPGAFSEIRRPRTAGTTLFHGSTSPCPAFYGPQTRYRWHFNEITTGGTGRVGVPRAAMLVSLEFQKPVPGPRACLFSRTSFRRRHFFHLRIDGRFGHSVPFFFFFVFFIGTIEKRIRRIIYAREVHLLLFRVREKSRRNYSREFAIRSWLGK